jgi:hypothetical protein
MTSQYPERVYSTSEEEQTLHLPRLGRGGISAGWLIAGLAAVGIGAWMAWHFGPDLRRYIKMERM